MRESERSGTIQGRGDSGRGRYVPLLSVPETVGSLLRPSDALWITERHAVPQAGRERIANPRARRELRDVRGLGEATRPHGNPRRRCIQKRIALSFLAAHLPEGEGVFGAACLREASFPSIASDM